MEHKRLVNAFKKAGATVKVVEGEKPGYCKAVATINGKSVEWYTEPKWFADKTRTDIIPVARSVFWRSPHTDIMSDCFCDAYAYSIKDAVALLTRL